MSGDVPEGWSCRRLGDVVEIVNDGISADTLAGLSAVAHYSLPAFDEGQTPEITAGLKIKSNKTLVPSDCVLFSKLNPRIPRVWRVAERSKLPSVCSTEFWPLVARSDDTDLDFLAAVVGSEAFLGDPQITPSSSTNSHQRVDRRSFENYAISLPPLDEQRRIAEVLRSVDEAYSLNDLSVTHLRLLRKLALRDLFTATDSEEAADTVLGPLPCGWAAVPAEDICEAVIDCKNRTPPITETGFAVVRTPNVRHGRFVRHNLVRTDAASFEEWTRRGRPKVGDVLITREAPIGEVCAVPHDELVCLGQRMMLYRPDPTKLDSSFLLYALQSQPVQDHLRNLGGGSTVGHVRVGDIRQLPIPCPPLATQITVAEMLAEIDVALDRAAESLTQTGCLKSSLASDLLSGRIRVPA